MKNTILSIVYDVFNHYVYTLGGSGRPFSGSQYSDNTRRLVLYIPTHQAEITPTGCAGKIPLRETPIGRHGCDLSDRHSLFPYPGRLINSLARCVRIYKTDPGNC